MLKYAVVCLALWVGLLGLPVKADLGFINLSKEQFEDISKDLAANFSHRSVSGAASLGATFGVEVNIFAASTSSSRLSNLSKASGGGDLPNLYNAGLMAGVSIPFGLTFEGMLLPSLDQDGVKFSGNSLGLRWLINDVVPVLPINLALRLNQSISTFGFTQNTSGVNGKVDSETKVQEVGLYLSPKMPVVEPYVGVSYVSANSSMDFVGTGSFFTVGNSQSASFGSTKTVLGLSVLVPFFSFGVEYVNLFGTSGYGLKLGMSF
ncbi:MAG: hypothetical protein N2Z70_06470 [Bdellovibrionaceae bacterium]|jgi:hypothetical protein|nr:hypothetical protein [Pseudobdellovibrionaceae bacterium]